MLWLQEFVDTNAFAELYNTPMLNLLEGAHMEEREDKLAKFFAREREVKLAYLFGSVVEEKTGGLSDVDVGVYLDDSLTGEERFKLQLELIAGLTSLLGTEKIDLIVMNDAPTALNFEIIKSNRLLLTRSGFDRVKFEHRVISRYLDRRYYDERSAEEFVKRVAERGLA